MNGTFYLVGVTGNKIQDILAQMRTRGVVGEVELSVNSRVLLLKLFQIVLQRRAGREHLHVLRFHKDEVVQLS